jgi:ribonucleotide monophosphatase NagD (HAD superfamily)
MGINSSIDTALVLSGVTKEKNIKDIEIEPTYIIESVESLVPGDATK